MRGSLLSSRARAARGVGRKRTAKSCPFCPDSVGNLAHLLQSCRASHGLRVKRHDDVARSLGDCLRRKGMTVRYEPRIPQAGTFLKPDIVAYNDCEALVLDPIVMSTAANPADYLETKRRKYQVGEVTAHCRALVLERRLGRSREAGEGAPVTDRVGRPWSDTSVEVFSRIDGIAVDWRGCWCEESYNLLTRTLGFSPKLLEYISVRILNSGYRVWTGVRRRSEY